MHNRTDPRVARTVRALQSAILELAARRPVSAISVADLTAAAGVSRASFYNHHDSPLALLISILRTDLDASHHREKLWRDTQAGRRATAEQALRMSVGEAVDHVARFAEIYKRALEDPADQGVYAALVQHFADYARDFMDRSQNPGVPSVNRPAAAQFLAHGFAGAIAAWLRDESLTRDDLLNTVAACAPPWWSL